MKSIALSLGVVVLALRCITTPTQPVETSITLRFGETGSAATTRITFADIADSRCPQLVSCVWAGDAAVNLTADAEGVVLHTNTTAGPASARVKDSTITLVEVRPERVSTDPPPKSAYVVVLRVTR